MKSTTVLSAKWSKNANKPFISLSWGNREEDIAYERGAIRRAESLNIAVRRFLLPADASQQELIQTLRTVNEDSSIHGCLLFRPLPPHLDTEAVTKALKECKGVVTVEDHNIINGLGSAVACVAADMGKGRVKRIGILDQFGQSAPYERLLAMNGITAENIVETVLTM